MNFRFPKLALVAAVTCVTAFPTFGQETSDTTAEPTPKTMAEVFEGWSLEPFSFEAMVSNQRRTRPEFQFKIDTVRYNVLFDAGRQKRNAILDCLELSDECEIKGTAFMLFKDGGMQMNVTDINWLAVPAVDFDEKAARLHRCFKSAGRDRKKFSGIVEAKMIITNLEKRQGYTLEPIKPREIGRGFEQLEDAVHNCSSSRFRLPVGEYHLKVFTQSGETFMDYFDE
ncbi:hypothetical protein OAC63_02600 [Amylibacter sp.]|jgi:hypothetical protein|nr:hypothetical protein [Amylibacter sp.]MDB9857261.1 hypothetical protein [Amylibacter sp.]